VGAEPHLLSGIDLNAGRIHGAANGSRPDLRIGSLPVLARRVDLVTQYGVYLHSGLELRRQRRRDAAGLRPGGRVFRYNNPRTTMSARLERASYAPGACEIELQPILLAPPIARFATRRSWVLAECLSVFPFLRTHYLGLIRKS
jgi:hypothetical protein